MKRTLAFLLVAAMLLGMVSMLPAPVWAAEEIASGTWYNLNWTLDSKGLLTISGVGEMASPSYDDAWCAHAEQIKSVIITDGVTTIARDAFNDFSYLTEISIPDSITSIGSYSFFNCYSLVKVVIPNNVTFIGNSAFRWCGGLESIVIGSGVKEIGAHAFAECRSLFEVTIPDGIQSIYNSTFYLCTSLSQITIPKSVTSIGDYAFASCSSLREITIPDSVTSIGDCAFNQCDSMTAIHVDVNNGKYCSIDGILYTKDGSTLLRCPGGRYTDCEIPDSVTRIADCAFAFCGSLTAVTIGSNVTDIADGAFQYCEKLYKVVNRSDLSIVPGNPDNGYAGYYAKAVVDSDGGCTYLDDSSFTYLDEANGLRFMYYQESYELIAYMGTEEDTILPSSISGCQYTVHDYAFCRNSIIESITILEGLSEISLGMFSRCLNLTRVVIPNSVKKISDSAFFHCQKLTEIVIPDSVREIGSGAFFFCSSLYSITFQGNAPEFGRDMFYEVTATAYYPSGNATWTEDVMQDYGGNITWIPYEVVHKHNYTAVVTESTCTEAGCTTYTCECGDSYTEEIPATGHDYVDGVCSHCGEVEFIPGDTTGDGRVNARDARALLRYIASPEESGSINEAAADFNGDGRVNARDARALLRAIADPD